MFLHGAGRVTLAALLLVSLPAGRPQATEWYGRVVAQSTLEGIGAARVTLEVVGDGASVLPGVDATPARTSTGADGAFAITASSGTRLRLSAPGFLDGFVNLHPGRVRDLGRLVLRHEASIAGRVTRNGLPAPSVRVLLPAQRDRYIPLGKSKETTSDAAGRFYLVGVRPEQLVELVLISGETAHAVSLGSASTPLDARHYELGDIELPRLHSLRGRVVEASGAAATGAIVRISRSSSLRLSQQGSESAAERSIPWPAARTSAEGRFELVVPAGEHTLMVLGGSSGNTSVVARIERAGSTTDLDTITLPGTLTRGGRIVDPSGEPLADVAVGLASVSGWQAIADDDPALRPPRTTTLTDSRGCYTLSGLPAAEAVGIEAVLEGFVSGRIRVDENGSTTTVVAEDSGECGAIGTTALAIAGRISGIVVDEDLRPIASAEIRVENHTSPRSVQGGRWLGAPLLSDANGRFDSGSLQQGDYALTIRSDGHTSTFVRNVAVGLLDSQPAPAQPGRRQPTTPAQIADSTGELDVTVRIVMTTVPLENRVPFEILVLDPRGAPEPEARVSANLNPGGGLTTSRTPDSFSGADGRVFYADAAPGAYGIAASARGSRNNSYWQGPFRVEAGMLPAIVEMEHGEIPFASLAGRFVDSNGLGIAHALIYARGSVRPLNRSQTITEADGSFRFDRIPAGRYLLRAEASDIPTIIHRTLLSVDPPGIDNVVVKVPPLATIIGTVTGLRDGEGEHLAVRAQTEEAHDNNVRQSSGVNADVDEAGNFRIDGLIPGKWTISAHVGGGREGTAEFLLDGSGDSARVTVAMSIGFTLSGRVVWRQDPPESARLEISGVGFRERRSALFDPIDRFEVRDLPAGEYRILMGDPSLRSTVVSFVDVHDDTDIEIVVRGASVAGRVVDATTGAPISGASMGAHPIPRIYSNQEQWSDRFGGFAFGPFAAGPWRFSVRADGYASRAPLIEIGDQDVTGLQIAMQKTLGLRLRFKTPDGTPPEVISLAWYDLEKGEGLQHSAFPEMTDSMEFSWPNVALTRGVLYASNSANRLAARLVVTNDGQPIDVSLHGAGRLFVDVPDLPAEERGAVARLFDDNGLPVTNRIGDIDWASRRNGVFRMSRLAAGTYRVVVTAHGGRTWIGEAEVRPFEDTQIVLR